MTEKHPHRAALTRRAFLTLPLAAAAVTACRRAPLPFVASDFQTPERSPMGLFPAADYNGDLSDVIFRGLVELGIDVRGRVVLLKPNIVEYEEGHAINTHPSVVTGAAIAMMRAGARQVQVGEGPGHRRDIEYLLTSTGLYDHLRELKVPFIDLNHDEVRDVRTRSWFTGMRSLMLPTSLLAADLVVSLPKLKTHHWAGVTCSMKNFFGTVPGAVYGWPKNLLHIKGIDRSILDLVATIRPGLTIVDGIVAMEGDGPIMGRARNLGFIAMGTDLPAVDSTCARVIGLDPAKVPYLNVAGRYLGNIEEEKIDQRGERPERYRTNFSLIDLWSDKRLPT